MIEFKDISAKEEPLKLRPEDSANRTEMESFWKDLRHFYRTGEITNRESAEGMHSLFHHLEIPDMLWPFQPDEETGPFVFNVHAPMKMLCHQLVQVERKRQKKVWGTGGATPYGIEEIDHTAS